MYLRTDKIEYSSVNKHTQKKNYKRLRNNNFEVILKFDAVGFDTDMRQKKCNGMSDLLKHYYSDVIFSLQII